MRFAVSAPHRPALTRPKTSVFTLALLMLLTSAPVRAARPGNPDLEMIAPGQSIQLPPGPGVDSEILGLGFDAQLRERDANGQQHRVHPAQYKTSQDNRFEVEINLIENQVELGGYARFLLLNGGGKRSETTRYAILRVMRTLRIDTLRDDLPRFDNATFVAQRVYYGWAVYHVIEGTQETFTQNLALSLKKLGLRAEQTIREQQLQVRKIYLGLDLLADGDKEVLISDRNLLEQQFRTAGKVVPIAVEYRALAPVPARAISWASTELRPGPYRLKSLHVRVSNSKADGRPWDALGDPPDPVARVFLDREQVANCFRPNRREFDCELNRVISLNETSSLRVDVSDRDWMADDPIGSARMDQLLSKGVAFDEIELPLSGPELEHVSIRLVPVSTERVPAAESTATSVSETAMTPTLPVQPSLRQLSERSLPSSRIDLPATPQPYDPATSPSPASQPPPSPPVPGGMSEFSLPSGLRIRRTTLGVGPRARFAQRVLVHYVVRTIADGRIVDDTEARQAPQALRIGEASPFPGLAEGIRGMTLGEERLLYVPAHLAYPILRPGQGAPHPEPLEVRVTLVRMLPQSPTEP